VNLVHFSEHSTEFRVLVNSLGLVPV